MDFAIILIWLIIQNMFKVFILKIRRGYHMKIVLNITICIALIWLMPAPINAAIKIIEADSSYVMGDNDSKIDARRIAIQEAKRKALEMAGTYLESLTEVKDMALSKDEVKAYTAGVVETEIVSEEMRGTAKNPEIFVKARCKIDTDVLVDQINNLRKNEELKEQLSAALKENDSLKKERDNLISKLSSEKDKSTVENIRKDLDRVLSKEEANDDTMKVWESFISKADIFDFKEDIGRMPQKDLDEAFIILNRVLKVNPKNQMAHLLLAMIYHRKGDIAGAKREIKIAMDINPSNPFLHMRLGVLLKDDGRYKEALKEFKLVQRLRPNDLRVFFYIGMTYNDAGDCKGAVFYLKKFLMAAKKEGRPFMRMETEAVESIKECEIRLREKIIERRPFTPK